MEISTFFLNLHNFTKNWNFLKINFFLNSYYIILHFVHLSFFKIIFLHVLYFFGLIKLNLNWSVFSMTYVSKSFQDKIFIFCMLQVLCTVNSIKKLEVASSLGSKRYKYFPELRKADYCSKYMTPNVLSKILYIFYAKNRPKISLALPISQCFTFQTF